MSVEAFHNENGKDIETASEEGMPRPGMKAQHEDKASDEYLKKRMRNNMAVKKSRDRSKKRILETQERVDQLTKENTELNQKVTLLSKELNVLRALFTNGGFTVPCNLQIVAQNPVSNGNSKPTDTTSTTNGANNQSDLTKMIPQNNAPKSSNNKNHTSVIRSASTSSPCHGVILVTEPGKMNLDIQAGIQFKEEFN